VFVIVNVVACSQQKFIYVEQIYKSKIDLKFKKICLFMKGKPTLSGFDIFVRTFGILQLSQINTPILILMSFFSQLIFKAISNSYQEEFTPKKKTCD